MGMLNLSDSEFSTIFLGNGEASSADPRKEELDRMMPEIIKRLSRKHAHVQFVFEDYYQKECPGGYGYTQFKKHVSAYREKNDYSYRNEHEPGREWQIDFAGDALYLTDPKTGAKQKLVVLVCVGRGVLYTRCAQRPHHGFARRVLLASIQGQHQMGDFREVREAGNASSPWRDVPLPYAQGGQARCNILKNNRDLERDEDGIVSRTPFIDNVRGAAAYRSVISGGKEVKNGK